MLFVCLFCSLFLFLLIVDRFEEILKIVVCFVLLFNEYDRNLSFVVISS